MKGNGDNGNQADTYRGLPVKRYKDNDSMDILMARLNDRIRRDSEPDVLAGHVIRKLLDRDEDMDFTVSLRMGLDEYSEKCGFYGGAYVETYPFGCPTGKVCDAFIAVYLDCLHGDGAGFGGTLEEVLRFCSRSTAVYGPDHIKKVYFITDTWDPADFERFDRDMIIYQDIYSVEFTFIEVSRYRVNMIEVLPEMTYISPERLDELRKLCTMPITEDI